MTFSFNAEALIEYREAADWYRVPSIWAAERFITSVEAAISAINEDPTRYQPTPDGLRIFRLKRYPYRLIYLVESDHFTIYAVEHEKRKPGYWRKRLE